VGFLEEVILRGFLFKALCKSNVKTAIAIGFAFTIIFYKGKCLWPCIITHSVVNSLSAFANREYAAYILNHSKTKN
jgi:membrane protease YdiL (CAAX protease family)